MNKPKQSVMISKQLFIFVFLLFLLVEINGQTKETISFTAKDQIKVTGDLYMTENTDAPFILLFHQASFSRGEYTETALMFNEWGFNCLAVDQRSGKQVNGILNETHKEALKKGSGTKYPDAFVDLEAAYTYVKKRFDPKKLIALGSSYSASLVFVLAAKHSDISGIVSFSPGEYFTYEKLKIEDWAKKVTCPVFVSSSKKEATDCKLIFEKAKNPKNIQFIPETKGFHGSKALWKSKEGYRAYRKALRTFLEDL
jgi:dienelactone hydrolase